MATAPFTEGVSILAEGELAIDENASTVSFAPTPSHVAYLSMAVPEGEERVRDFLDQLNDEDRLFSKFER